ncbi:MAG: hydroxypyruvate isomerase family protein [Gemmatimonadota bacterium]
MSERRDTLGRREVLSRLGGVAAGAALGASLVPSVAEAAAASAAPSPVWRTGTGRLRQSVCRWCYPSLSVDALCREAQAIGLGSVELLGETEWHIPATYGLTCAMANGPSTIALGFNRPDQHDRLVAEGERLLALVGAARLPNLIVFSGNRAGMSDGEGLANCARGLTRLMPAAERAGVTVCLELLNSKVDHADYMADHTAWGAALARTVNHPRFKLLYDIYHMQIMEGDVIRTIRANADVIGHYHTAGVPGRHELDDTQELQYGAVMRAIAGTGYTGWIGQEFIPTRDPMTSLRQAVTTCTV